MSEWYYADAQRERHGPVDAGAIREKFRQGELDLTALVWREGMSQWQPLSAVAEELQLLVQETTGIDLRSDYAAIENGTAPEPAILSAATAHSPYAAPGSISIDSNHVVAGGDIVHAGFLRRFAASTIDSLVTGVISYALLIPLALVMGVSVVSMAGSEMANVGAMLIFYALYYAICILVPAVYFGWMQSSSNMASLGKLAVGAKVVRVNGERISFWRAFLRYIAMAGLAVVTCGVAMLVSAIMVGVSERKQGLHDMICDTVVVDKWAFTEHPEWQERGLGTVTIVVLSLFGLMLAATVVLVIVALSIGASGFNH
ncbi:RDD family protein [Stenotrophomonas sp. Iso1]|uniref:RDD family protein n=1 Tax=Stenotrophomonas sp. Iso1 TaxID=2977283 RepID=UPI0022B77AE6|nr:RDD family protein [Stenotrophomonas sp. Iso1]